MRGPRRVVVTGLGLVSCLGSSVAKNWSRLMKNECGLGPLKHLDDMQIGPCKIGGSVDEPDLETRWQTLLEDQAHLLGVERRIDRRAVSRASRLGMIAAQEALRQSGWLPSTLGGTSSHHTSRDYSRLDDETSLRAGTYFSSGLEGVSEVLATQAAIDKRGYKGVGAHVLPRTLANMPAAHISRAWGLRGPTMACNTACASGLHSVGEAFRMIQYGEADMMLAGATEAPLDPWVLAAFSRIRALSGCNGDSSSLAAAAQSASRPFDAKRDGFVMAEGAAALVLSVWPPPPHAQLNGVLPLAEILGFGRSADAYSLVQPEPTGDGALRSMKAALDDACVDSLDELEHINCHATSTPLGDTIELAAVARLLNVYKDRASGTVNPIQVNSIKGHLGHSLGAAGAIEAAYSVLAAQHGIYVANHCLTKPIGPAEIADVLAPHQSANAAELSNDLFKHCSLTSGECARSDQRTARRLVLSNSFGFGGTNASLVMSNWVA